MTGDRQISRVNRPHECLEVASSTAGHRAAFVHSTLNAGLEWVGSHRGDLDLAGRMVARSLEHVRVSPGPCPEFVPAGTPSPGPLSVVNSVSSDAELFLDQGFSIQASASTPHAFARPYYVDPVHGVNRCAGLPETRWFQPRAAARFDFSFVGHDGNSYADESQACFGRVATRKVFCARLHRFAMGRRAGSMLTTTYQRHFNRIRWPAHSVRLNATRRWRYIESLSETRLPLCPRGRGRNSIRFFEALAVGAVPVYVGDPDTRFPLDWILDWESLVFRLSPGALESDAMFGEALSRLLDVSAEQLEARRRSIFAAYWLFLAPAQRDLFETLVWFRVKELLDANVTTH